jgi:hypothetical protein
LFSNNKENAKVKIYAPLTDKNNILEKFTLLYAHYLTGYFNMNTSYPLRLFYLILLLLTASFPIQAQLTIGQWREHLSYKKGIAITQSEDKIYYASESGMFQLNKSDYSIDRLSKITGLSDVDVTTIRYQVDYKTLVIAYKNANIDLLINNHSIYNISDIKRKIINAKKTINHIYFRDRFAYLSCGFGIVVLDLSKKEITDTYYLGTNNSYLNVRALTSDNNYFYAATDKGVLQAPLQGVNLANFNSWKKLQGIPDGIYNAIACLDGKIFTNRSQKLSPTNPSNQSDTIYCFENNTWSKPIPDKVYFNNAARTMEVNNNQLIIAFVDALDFYSSTGTLLQRLVGSLTKPAVIKQPMQGIIDSQNATYFWMADHESGLVKNKGVWSGTTNYFPDGPSTSNAFSLLAENDNLWVTQGSRSDIWIGVYLRAEAYQFSNESWSKFTRDEMTGLDSLRDLVSIAIDPSDRDHLFMSTLGQGVVEMKNGKQLNLLNETNSALQSRGDATFHWVGSFSMAYDKDENLWMTNCYAQKPLVVRKKDGTWQNFGFAGLITTPTIGQLVITKSNQKWMQLPRGGGIAVYDHNNTWATADDKVKILNVGAGKGNLPSNEVTCLAEDKNGEIWVGTDKGIAVFYCADRIFSSACDAQRIFIQQDGHTQYLLETETIKNIVVDGANRKWIGTQNSGVYLMSADGTTEIHHFTEDNSPLLSNEIKSIAVNAKTGEVFFATGKGIISYKSDAIEASEDYSNSYAFPNPVKPGYEGPIAITGLVENATVKITDVSGALVYETKALGGQAIWYGKNFKGEKSASGVYMVFCSNEDGSRNFATKILLVK